MIADLCMHPSGGHVFLCGGTSTKPAPQKMYLAMFFGAKDFNQVKPSLHPSKIYLAMLPLCRGLQSGGWGVGGSSGRRHSRSV